MKKVAVSPKEVLTEIFLDAYQLAARWGNCHPKTAKRRAQSLKIKTFRPSQRSLLYPLSEILKAEGKK